MKLNISPVIIFRTPRFSYQADLKESWDELKGDIKVSSPEFYKIISGVSKEQLIFLPDKVKFTIWKYFNRARYRATPFGTFGAFGIAEGIGYRDPEKIIIESKFTIHSFVNWPHKNELSLDYESLLKNNCQLFSNSSYYKCGEFIRYIANNNKHFELAEIGFQEIVWQILNECRIPINFKNLAAKLKIKGKQLRVLVEILLDMLEIQMLFTEKDPNILGEDYFRRIKVDPGKFPDPYLISEVKVKDGFVDMKLFRFLPEWINLVQGLLPVNRNSALEGFIERFRKKFHRNEIPLMVALDPEIGVGYDELEQGSTEEFVKNFNGGKRKTLIKHDLQFFLQRELNSHDKKIVKLEGLNLPHNQNPIPNSLSVIARVVDDKVFVDTIGGTTANALNGRFTLASDNLHNISKDIAAREADANPEVLFFDVGYIAEANVDNINRRKSIYSHQLSILNFDTSQEPLTLDDLYVSIKGDVLMLRSARLNRRMVPKLASAYNYIRSDLSLFRLLCDLQQQGITSQLSLNIEKMFPDMENYPEIRFKNLIVSPQKWKISKSEVNEVIKGKENALGKILKEKEVSRFFKAGLADQTLVFDSEDSESLTSFVHWVSKQEAVVISEVELPGDSCVIDEERNPYLAQFILNINHGNEIYSTLNSKEVRNSNKKVEQFFPPGSEWLYYEIYCHPQRSQSLMSGPIRDFLEDFNHSINKWFFINYNENGNHIRLRIHLTDHHSSNNIHSEFLRFIGPDINNGLISDLQIKTYRRETVRYGMETIEDIERHFWVDSTFSLSIIELQLSEMEKYSLCIDLAIQSHKVYFIDPESFISLIKKVSESFNAEHDLKPEDFKMLNVQYQELLKLKIAKRSVAELAYKLQTSFHQCLKPFKGSKQTLFVDLFHMHVNRLFPERQRTHEMIIYYFLLKNIYRTRALSRI